MRIMKRSLGILSLVLVLFLFGIGETALAAEVAGGQTREQTETTSEEKQSLPGAFFEPSGKISLEEFLDLATKIHTHTVFYEVDFAVVDVSKAGADLEALKMAGFSPILFWTEKTESAGSRENVTTLLKKADGVVLDFSLGEATLKEILSALHKSVHIGLYMNENLGMERLTTRPAYKEAAYEKQRARMEEIVSAYAPDFVMTTLDTPIMAGGTEADFSFYITENKRVLEALNISFYPVLNLATVEETDSYELPAQTVLAKAKADGIYAYQNLETLQENEQLLLDMSQMNLPFTAPDLSYDDEFLIRRPKEEVTVRTKTFFILGTADPKQVVKVEGEKIETGRGKNGSFGYLAQLKPGKNEFVFEQNSTYRTVIINYEAEEKPVKIGNVTKSAAFPKEDTVVYAGGTLSLSVTGPAGESVFAKLGKDEVLLKQKVASAEAGTPVTFEGKYHFSSKAEAGVSLFGKIFYYVEGKEPVESGGTVYLASEGSTVLLRAKRTLVGVYETPGDYKNYEFSGVYHENIVDELAGYESGMAKLKSGGYVAKKDMEVLEGEHAPLSQTFTSAEFSQDQERDVITLRGASNVANRISHKTAGGEDGLLYEITLHYVRASDRFIKDLTMADAFSDTFDLFVKTNQDSITLTISVNNANAYSGVSLETQGADTILFFRRPAKVSQENEAFPLRGVTVLVDAGHGGKDGGALGVQQEEGAMEKDVALAHALETKRQLEKKGATVYMVRDADYFLDIYTRAGINERIKPDFFISLHLNSANENSNAAKADGTEIYYHNIEASRFAYNMSNTIETVSGRKNRGVIEGAYVIARPNIAPSLLCELGFMPNPVQYDELLDEEDIAKTVEGIVEAILITVQNS